MGSGSPRGSGCGTALGGGTTDYISHYQMQSTDLKDRKGTLQVRKNRIIIAFGAGVHHGLRLDVPGLSYYIYGEWNSRVNVYTATKDESNLCQQLGTVSIKDFSKAIQQSSSKGNCNQWTERVCWKLGYDVTASWSCTN